MSDESKNDRHAYVQKTGPRGGPPADPRVSPAPEVPTPPAPTGEPGDPSPDPLPDLDSVRRDVERQAAAGMARVIDERMTRGAKPNAQEEALWREGAERQRHPSIILGPVPSAGPAGPVNLEWRVATLERHAEAVGAGLSQCEAATAAMTTTHADRIETIEDEVRSLKRAVLELREIQFASRHAASDEKLRKLVEPDKCPRCGSRDRGRFMTYDEGDYREPGVTGSCQYLGDADPWHGAQARCGTCKFWGSDPEDDEIRKENPSLWARVRPCAGVRHDSGDSGPYPHDLRGSTRADVLDGSGYYASLRTREDFGCVLWEKRGDES